MEDVGEEVQDEVYLWRALVDAALMEFSVIIITTPFQHLRMNELPSVSRLTDTLEVLHIRHLLR